MKKNTKHVLDPSIEDKIVASRGRRIIMDFDLASVYGVTTTRLNQQVRRNRERFPEDFVFELTKDETAFLMQQSAERFCSSCTYQIAGSSDREKT